MQLFNVFLNVTREIIAGTCWVSQMQISLVQGESNTKVKFGPKVLHNPQLGEVNNSWVS